MNYPDMIMPSDYLNTNSALLSTVRTHNIDGRYVSRYIELRKTVLSYSSIISKFEQFLAVANEDIRIEDITMYPDIPDITTNTLAHLRAFVAERLFYLDTMYGVEV
jgi:hypothetical protein